MEEKIELNLKNPIFVYYISISNRTRQSIERDVQQIQKAFSIYSNITVWIVPTESDTRIEYLYGDKPSKNSVDFLSNVKKLVDLGEYDKLKVYLRDLKLDIINQ